MQYDRRKQRGGFSLVEVIVALVVLGVGLLAFMRFFPLGLRQAQVAQERSVASEVANDRMARIQMAGSRNLIANGVNSPWFNLNTIGAAGAAYSQYVGDGFTTTVQPMTGMRDTGLQRVTFSVQMPDGRRETYVTYVTDI
jgi:prepilin-type N-terminal cleavage/methylation domain-containing protein